jgi:hypothetical protein
MSSSEAGDTPPSYIFVTGDNTRDGRSHAIRAHWRQRRQRTEMQRREREEQDQRPLRTIMPGPGGPANEGGPSRMPPVSAPEPPLHVDENLDDEGPASSSDDSGRDSPFPPGEIPLRVLEGIPAQALSGMNLALGSSRLDPFDRFPIQLTSKHHRLLHHCMSSKYY